MKKLFILIFLFLGTISFAQNKNTRDTIVINKIVSFENTSVIDKNGKEKIRYYAVYEGKYYDSNKYSYERYNLIKKFGGEPCVVIIRKDKYDNGRIIVL